LLTAVAVVKQGKKVICGSQSGVLAIWSWGYWNDCSDRFPGHPESVDAIVKFDDDTIITGSSDGALRVVNILPNKLLGVVGEHADDLPVERLALSVDRRLLVSISHDSTAKLWDMSMLLEEPDDEDDEEDNEELQDKNGQPTGAAAAAAADAERASAPAEAGSKPADGADEGNSHEQEGHLAAGDHAGSDTDSDSDGGNARQGQRKKRKRHEKTAMKGRSKPGKSSNFFADML
jgi:ATP-dependent RNA helicase DOB1